MAKIDKELRQAQKRIHARVAADQLAWEQTLAASAETDIYVVIARLTKCEWVATYEVSRPPGAKTLLGQSVRTPSRVQALRYVSSMLMRLDPSRNWHLRVCDAPTFRFSYAFPTGDFSIYEIDLEADKIEAQQASYSARKAAHTRFWRQPDAVFKAVHNTFTRTSKFFEGTDEDRSAMYRADHAAKRENKIAEAWRGEVHNA